MNRRKKLIEVALPLEAINKASAREKSIRPKEILTALNKPEEYILAIVPVDGDLARAPRYVRRPFLKEPDFGAESVNYDLDELLAGAESPA